MNRRLCAALLLAAALALPPPVAASPASEGLVAYDHGAAAHYAANYDDGEWERIIRRHISWGQHDAATFPYSPEGYYCVHPDFAIGNVLTLSNPRTGVWIRCTIGDAVATQDVRLWRSRWCVEMSWAAFRALSLDEGNEVVVWVMGGGG